MRRNHLLSKTLALNLFPKDAICSLHPSRLGDLDCYRSRTIALSWFHRSVLHYQLEILGVCGDVPTLRRGDSTHELRPSQNFVLKKLF